ncbi:MAG TPA: discoidin domain-containing protein, partial [Roseimicrobium sp.]|nr:discoidin domain-containing protein [Roseimicrobium sp.]
MEGRVNFEDRMENVKFYGSNAGKTWTELTPNSTRTAKELTTIPVAEKLAGSTFRFLRVWKRGGGLESSEMRIFGSRHETGNKLESVSLSSEKQQGIRVALGEVVRLSIQAREPISQVRVRIQGIDAPVKQTGADTYVAEAVLRPGEVKTGPVEFSIDYQRQDGTPADTTYVTTDGSRLIVVDESKLIRDLPELARIIDPDTRAVSKNSPRIIQSLSDNNPRTFAELSLKGQGTGVPLEFDFGPARRVELSGVELLARPDYRDRTAGAIVQGSNDGQTWTTLSEAAAETEQWQNLKMKPSGQAWRYIQIINPRNWSCNVSEVRFHGDVK